ncbi:neurotrophin-3-like isoform X2 [Patiria miniata]|uniref:Nerve growth factor-related domain-containing protein n=1 Tax=Patiria miniata TaxID=46514 RepID=A0A913ZDH3_PATMI|nr:neurotrophin-3-like isoform X2 [Patiria miniata]
MVLCLQARLTVIMGQTARQVCIRRLLALAIFLLPWAICNAAPYQLTDHKHGHWPNDTMTGTSSMTRKKHNSHVEGKDRNCKHDHGSNSRRHHRDRHRNNPHRHRSRDNEVVPLRSTDDILNEIPTYVSDLVVFSPVKPANPPWSPEAVRGAETTNEVTERHVRDKRSTTQGEPYRAVCEPDSNWMEKTWAYDILGNNVTVVNEITTSDGTQMKQWFFQTTCKRTQGAPTTPQTCAGIDSRMYESECEEKRSFVYAVVRTARGEQGWNWVTISTSCNCAFRPVRNPSRRAWPPAYSSIDAQTQPTILRER